MSICSVSWFVPRGGGPERRGRSMVPRPGFALLPCAHPCASNRQGDDLAGDLMVSGNDPRLWDPATATVTPLTKPGYDIFCSGHAFLADGRLFVAGGHIHNDVGLPNASMYNPFTNQWSSVPDMNAGRWYPTATTLANGDVLVVSGSIDTSIGENRLPEVFQVGSGTWRDLTNAQISLDLYPRMHLAPNGRVFNSSPSTVTRYLNTSGTGAWTVVANQSVNVYRDYGPSVMYDNGKVLVVGGGDPPTNTAEVIDLNASSPAWRSSGFDGLRPATAQRHAPAGWEGTGDGRY